jgi:hypothetical protein
MHPVGTVPALCTLYDTAPRLKSNSASYVKKQISGKLPIMSKCAWVDPMEALLLLLITLIKRLRRISLSTERWM